MKVLIDRKEGDYFIGRTEYDSPEVDNEVLIAARPLLGKEGWHGVPGWSNRIGSFAIIKITEAGEYDLVGEMD